MQPDWLRILLTFFWLSFILLTLVAVGSFTNSLFTRLSDFANSILTSLKLETLSPQIKHLSFNDNFHQRVKNINKGRFQKRYHGLVCLKGLQKTLKLTANINEKLQLHWNGLISIAFDQIFIGFVVWPFTLTLTFPVMDNFDVWPQFQCSVSNLHVFDPSCGTKAIKSRRIISSGLDAIGRGVITPCHLQSYPPGWVP